jgi:CheY-like chemotaxis protein
LTVSSVVGVGSAFRLEIPLERDPAAVAVAARRFEAGARILVIQENPVAREILARHIENLGGTPVTDLDFPTAATAGDARLRAIIVDDHADGAEHRVIAAMPPRGPKPIVVLATELQWPPSGYDAILRQPLTQQAVSDALNALFPAGDPPRAALAAAVAAKGTVAGGAALPAPMSYRILLADDNETNQEVAMAILDRMGHSVTVVENGIDAVSEVATGMFDLVLMDMMMPRVDGLAATRAIRRLNGAQSGTYIIAVTANASAEDRNRCLAAGMDDHMAKPITLQRLGVALERYMNRRGGRVIAHRQ